MSDILDSRQASMTFRSLGASGRVLFCADACLDLRPARLPCSRCSDTCPVDALTVSADGAMLADRCIGCGRCAAECPTGALVVSGFEIDPVKCQESRIECRRVPEQLSGHAARVPCIGGVSAESLLELAAQTRKQWQFVDRGWCDTCTAGKRRTRAIFDAFDASSRVLGELGLPEHWHPRVIQEPVPVKFARPAGVTASDTPVSRRGFLGALMRKAVETAEHSTAPQVQLAADRGGCKPSPVIRARQERYGASLRQLAAAQGRSVSAALFPRLEVAGHCDHTGLCAAVCPTGALSQYAAEDGNAVGIEFDAQACIGCGLCASLCPSQALRLLPAGNAEISAETVATKLTRHEKQRCPDCATQFLSAGFANSRCQRCQIDQNLARSLFGRSPSGERAQAPQTRNLLSGNFTAL